MFGLSYLRIGMLVAVAFAVIAAVGYHFYETSWRDRQISSLTAENAAHVEARARLEESNRSLEGRITQLENVNRQMLTENANLRAADRAVQDRLAATERRILDAETRARMSRLREGRGAEHLLGVINRDLNCTMQRITEDGECVAGVWRPSRR